MSSDMIAPEPAPRIDTLVLDPETGEQRRRTDYAGTVWYGGKPQMMRGMVVSTGAGAQITTPFWLPDSHLYAVDAEGVQVQASASIQSVYENCQIVQAAAALGPDPANGSAMRVYMGITASARVPLGVSYRVTVVCRPDAVQHTG